jgi:hypothetical protein
VPPAAAARALALLLVSRRAAPVSSSPGHANALDIHAVWVPCRGSCSTGSSLLLASSAAAA